MNRFKLWPHLTIVALLCATVGGAVGYFLTKHRGNEESLTLPSVARVERVNGQVGLQRGLNSKGTDAQWTEITPNTPISVGDRIYAHHDSRTSLAFTGRNFARLEPDSSLDVLSLSPRYTQLALRDGSAIFNLYDMPTDGLFEVATPLGAVDLEQPGLYQIGLLPDGSAQVSVLSGLAQIVGLAGSGQISKGEMLTLAGQTAANYVLSRISPDYAGNLLDNYYAYQYGNIYDGRYRDYNAYLSDPYYYDPYNRYASYRYVDNTIPGVWTLDQYGDWVNLNDYGYVWQPRVETNWTPYQQGYWTMDDPYGLTWVSDEPWGYAPYHYGRWANVSNQWYWVPDRVNTQPTYSPALVAFIPLTQTNEIGWVPLAPNDPYVPTYYDANLQPHYLARTAPVVQQQQIVNLNVPGAVTVVSVNDFDRDITPKAIRRVDRNALAGVRPVLDPLTVGELRQLALSTTNTHCRVDLPPGIAKKLDTTQVFTSAKPFAPPFREDMARVMHVEPVPENQKRQKLQFRDERQSSQLPTAQTNAPAPVETRKETKEAPAPEAARSNGVEKPEAKGQNNSEQRAARQPATIPAQPNRQAQAESERAPRAINQRAQGERVGTNQKAQREVTQQQVRPRVEQQPRPQREARTPPVQARPQQAPVQVRPQQAPAQARPPAASVKQNNVHPQAPPQSRPQAAKPEAPAQPRPAAPGGQGGEPHGKGKGKP